MEHPDVTASLLALDLRVANLELELDLDGELGPETVPPGLVVPALAGSRDVAFPAALAGVDASLARVAAAVGGDA